MIFSHYLFVCALESDQKQKVALKLQKKSEAESGSGSRIRPLLTWPPQYSLDELLARPFSPLIVATMFFIIGIYAFDHNRPQHLYSILLPEYKNAYSFFGLLAIEAVFVTMICNFVPFSIGCQLLFFGKCQAEFKQMELQLR